MTEDSSFRYTFGKPLIGANVSINATASGIGRWEYDQNKDLVKNISDYQRSDEKGCAIFDLVVSKIGIGHRAIRGGNTVRTAGQASEYKTTSTKTSKYTHLLSHYLLLWKFSWLD